MSQELRSQVESWLDAMGNPYEKQKDPQANWHLGVTYPKESGHRMHVVQPKGKDRAVLIATGVNMSPEHVKAFNQLPESDQKLFHVNLRRTLSKVDADFQIRGVDSPSDPPQQIQVETTRYDDGLSLDSFSRSVGAVFKTKLEAIWFIQEELDDNGPGTGGSRFDFERLGT